MQVVQTLTRMVGRSVKLYDMVLQFLRTLFLRTRNVHYCTLRAELLMSLHDLDVGEICCVDPCHKVAPPDSPGPLPSLSRSPLGSARPPGPRVRTCPCTTPPSCLGTGWGEPSTQPRSSPPCSISPSPAGQAPPPPGLPGLRPFAAQSPPAA